MVDDDGSRDLPVVLVHHGGLGIGVVGHFVAVFFGQGYVEYAARREYLRLKNQGPQT